MTSVDVARLVESIRSRVEADGAKITLYTRRESRHYDSTDALEDSQWPKGTWGLDCVLSAHGRYVNIGLMKRYARLYVSGDDEVWVIGMLAAVQEAFEPYRNATWLLYDLRVMFPLSLALGGLISAVMWAGDGDGLHAAVSRALVGAAALGLAVWLSIAAAVLFSWVPYARFRSISASTRATGAWLLVGLTVILAVEGLAQLLLTWLR